MFAQTCIDSSFLASLGYSSFMLFLVTELEKKSGQKTGLKDVFSTPVLSALFLAFLFFLFTFDFPDKGSVKSFGTMASNITSNVYTFICTFVLVLNYWGQLLMYWAFYQFLKRWFPNQIEAFENKIKSIF